jgi:hypothetical protein
VQVTICVRGDRMKAPAGFSLTGNDVRARRKVDQI